MNRRLILFEILIGGLAVLPALSVWRWPAEVPFPAWEGVFAYLAGNAWFYFLAARFHFQDRRKSTYPLMATTVESIRLIWAGYFFFLGCVLFVFPRFFGAIDVPRLLGVGICLYLFVSSNFRLNLHPSSSFSGSFWVGESSTFRRRQRGLARYFFALGLVVAAIFFWLPGVDLIWGFVGLGWSVFYGIVFRLLPSFLRKP